MKLSNLKQIVATGIAGAYLLFSSGCSGNPNLHFALEKFPELHNSFEETFQGRPKKKEYMQPTVIAHQSEKSIPSTQYNYDMGSIQSNESGTDSFYSKSQLEKTYRNLEIIADEKLGRYEGRKESLSELEQALERLRNDVLRPTLEAKARYENSNK